MNLEGPTLGRKIALTEGDQARERDRMSALHERGVDVDRALEGLIVELEHHSGAQLEAPGGHREIVLYGGDRDREVVNEGHRKLDVDLGRTVTDEPGNGEGHRLGAYDRRNGIVDALYTACDHDDAGDVGEVRALVEEVDVADLGGPGFMGDRIDLIKNETHAIHWRVRTIGVPSIAVDIAVVRATPQVQMQERPGSRTCRRERLRRGCGFPPAA